MESLFVLLAQVDPIPPSFDFPGSSVFRQLLSWLHGIGFWSCVAGVIVGGMMLWGGGAAGHPGKRATGKWTIGLSLLGAIVLGATYFLVNQAAGIGGSVR